MSEKKPRAQMGRPAFEPNDGQRQLVQVLVANGIAHTVIAKNVGCSIPTLKRYFKAELVDGHERVEAAMGAAIVRAGLAGNLNAAKYWLMTRGDPRWRITENRHHSGAIETNDLSTEDLERELEQIRARERAADRPRTVEAEVPDELPGVLH